MRSLKRLSHRNWATLRDRWIAHLPVIDFDLQCPEPSLSQIPSLDLPECNASGIADLAYVDGIREAIFREALILARKFQYCSALLPTLAAAGKNTWTATTGYECAFYGAKALCYLLGFASVNRDSKLYLDAFLEVERKVGKKKKIFFDTIRVHKLDDRLTHEVLWKLTQRLIETTTFSEDLQPIQADLRVVDWGSFSHFRNKVYYDGAYWPLGGDMSICDLARPRLNGEIVAAANLDLPMANLPFAREYFMVSANLRRLLSGLLESISMIAPAMRTEVVAFATNEARALA